MSSLSYAMTRRPGKPRGRGRGDSCSFVGRGNPRADDMGEFLDDTTFGLGDHDDRMVTTPTEPSHTNPSPTNPSPTTPASVSGSTRGPNRPMPTPLVSSQQPRLQMGSNAFLDIHVSREMTMIFRGAFRGPWHSFKKIPPAELDYMFECFRGKYQWEPDEEGMVRSAWTNAMKNRHKGWLKNAREWAAKQAFNVDGIQWDKEDMAVIRGHHPSWIPEPFWHRMIDQVWSKDSWKKISRSARANRKTEYQGKSSRHVGGSISTAQHRYKMAQAWGRDPTTSEVYERLHCTNRKYAPGATGPPTDPPVYVYAKAEHAAVRFHELREVALASQEPDAPPIDEASLWEQSVGGWNKGRLFGFGTTQDPRYAMRGECSSSSNDGRSLGTRSTSELAELTEKMTKIEEEANEAKEREERYQVQLEIEKKRNEDLQAEQVRQATQLAEQLTLSQQFAAFMRQQGFVFPPPGPTDRPSP